MDSPSCLILDVRLRGESGLAFQEQISLWRAHADCLHYWPWRHCHDGQGHESGGGGERPFGNRSRGIGQIVEALNDLQDLREGAAQRPAARQLDGRFRRKLRAPLLARFSEIYPDIAFDVLLNDRPADFVTDQINVAFRNGRIEDSSIVAKRLVSTQTVLCVSRDYVTKRGLP